MFKIEEDLLMTSLIDKLDNLKTPYKAFLTQNLLYSHRMDTCLEQLHDPT